MPKDLEDTIEDEFMECVKDELILEDLEKGEQHFRDYTAIIGYQSIEKAFTNQPLTEQLYQVLDSILKTNEPEILLSLYEELGYLLVLEKKLNTNMKPEQALKKAERIIDTLLEYAAFSTTDDEQAYYSDLIERLGLRVAERVAFFRKLLPDENEKRIENKLYEILKKAFERFSTEKNNPSTTKYNLN